MERNHVLSKGGAVLPGIRPGFAPTMRASTRRSTL